VVDALGLLGAHHTQVCRGNGLLEAERRCCKAASPYVLVELAGLGAVTDIDRWWAEGGTDALARVHVVVEHTIVSLRQIVTAQIDYCPAAATVCPGSAARPRSPTVSWALDTRRRDCRYRTGECYGGPGPELPWQV
jgi:hypothetical protein